MILGTLSRYQHARLVRAPAWCSLHIGGHTGMHSTTAVHRTDINAMTRIHTVHGNRPPRARRMPYLVLLAHGDDGCKLAHFALHGVDALDHDQDLAPRAVRARLPLRYAGTQHDLQGAGVVVLEHLCADASGTDASDGWVVQCNAGQSLQCPQTMQSCVAVWASTP